MRWHIICFLLSLAWNWTIDEPPDFGMALICGLIVGSVLRRI